MMGTILGVILVLLSRWVVVVVLLICWVVFPPLAIGIFIWEVCNGVSTLLNDEQYQELIKEIDKD